MPDTDRIEMLALAELFKDKTFVVPLYQRNYAWGQAEIVQMIQDAWDSAIKMQTESYYLGTLVTFKRKTDYGIEYEVIDGQQRLTTLLILANVLVNEFQHEFSYSFKDKLKFDCRPLSTNTLFQFTNKLDNNTDVNENMLNAYGFIKKKITELITCEKEKETFFNYQLNAVKLLHVEVPYDTNLNHYFEIMNNRGEQLEKHEILKAELLAYLIDDEIASKTFTFIWEACSNMERYIQYGFEKDLRDEIFEESWNVLPENFEDTSQCVDRYLKEEKRNSESSQNENFEGGNFLVVLSTSKDKLYIKKEKAIGQESFSSIITFPNFLLHTLRIFTKKDIPLDDKRLIDNFKTILEENKGKEAIWVKEFGQALLKLKFLYDSYIIKRNLKSDTEEWELKEIKRGSKDNYHYAGTYTDINLNERVTMLLTMFHVSFPQMIYKHWLNGALLFLSKGYAQKGKIEAIDYIKYLERMSDAFYFDRFGSREISYYDIIYKHQSIAQNKTILEHQYLNIGTQVQNFIFNRLDYLIWNSIVVKNQNKFNLVSDNFENAKKFKFSVANTSVEHFFPRNPIQTDHIPISEDYIDHFGNLCLLSRNKNAKLSNHSPVSKAEYYAKSDSIDSLKQQLMLEKNKEWNKDTLIKHQSEMIQLLSSKTIT